MLLGPNCLGPAWLLSAITGSCSDLSAFGSCVVVPKSLQYSVREEDRSRNLGGHSPAFAVLVGVEGKVVETRCEMRVYFHISPRGWRPPDFPSLCLSPPHFWFWKALKEFICFQNHNKIRRVLSVTFSFILRGVSGQGGTLAAVWQRVVGRACLPPDCSSSWGRPMLEPTSGGNRPLSTRFVGLVPSVCPEPEALPKLKSVMSLPIWKSSGERWFLCAWGVLATRWLWDARCAGLGDSQGRVGRTASSKLYNGHCRQCILT